MAAVISKKEEEERKKVGVEEYGILDEVEVYKRFFANWFGLFGHDFGAKVYQW